jgi:hypothetical protein
MFSDCSHHQLEEDEAMMAEGEEDEASAGTGGTSQVTMLTASHRIHLSCFIVN